MYKSSLFINQKTLGKLIIYFFILLCFFDLIYPNKGENVNRIVPVIGRSLFLFVSILYVFNTVFFREIRIKKTLTGGSFVLLGFLFLVVSILINPTSFVININIFVKILYWIFGFFFFYYALSKGTINEKQLKIFVSIAVLIYFSVIIRDFNNVDLFRGSKNYFVSNNSYIFSNPINFDERSKPQRIQTCGVQRSLPRLRNHTHHVLPGTRRQRTP